MEPGRGGIWFCGMDRGMALYGGGGCPKISGVEDCAL